MSALGMAVLLLLILAACGGEQPMEPTPAGVDTDGDGVLDADETAGWTVFVDQSGQGDNVERAVSSDPQKADTDGDGLDDSVERSLRTDPTSSDTDSDGLSDADEINTWGSSPISVDTDGDATDLGTKPLNPTLFDGNEVASLGTSPTLSDTDGDKISDFVELLERGNEFHPLIANLPQMELSYEGATDLRVNISFDDGSQQSETREAGLSWEESTTFSASTTGTVKVWAEVSAKVTAETGFGVNTNKVGGEVGASAGVSAELSATLSASSTQSAQETYQEAVQTSREQGRSLESGTLGIGIVVRNAGDVSFNLSNLAITAVRRDLDDPTSFSTVATLTLPSGIVLAPGGASGLLRAEVEIPANVALELMANPQTLTFETGAFDLLDDEERNFAFLSEVTNSRTALVTIEYGNGNVVRKRVATNVKREDGQIVGVPLGEVLTEVLDISFQTEQHSGGNLVLTSLFDRQLGQDVANVDAESTFWTVLVSDGIDVTDETDFEDIVLRAGEAVYLLYLRDRDQDGLFARDEFIYGTDDTQSDTDGDGLTDYEEVREGWSVVDIGVPPYPQFVYPDPTRTDTDGDSRSDAEEMAMGTDPRNADTDGEGILDAQDADPLDPLIPVNQPPVIEAFDVTPTGLMATLTATVTEPDTPGAIVEVLVQWGDATEETVTDNFQNIVLMHDYPESGQYTITLTATDNRNGITSDTRDVDVTTFPLEGLIAEYLMNAGDVYSYSGQSHTPDNGPNATTRVEATDPPGPTDGRIYRWNNAAYTSGDGGVWIASDRFGFAESAFYFNDQNVIDDFYGNVIIPNLGFEQSFSLAVWVREDDDGGWLVGQEGWARLELLNNAAGVEFIIPGGVTLTDNTPLVEDAWHFYVATVFFDESTSSTTVRLFRDGNLVANQSGIGGSMGFLNPDLNRPLLIGDATAESRWSDPVRAYIDDVRVWNRALSAAEVRVLCESGGFSCPAG